MSSASIIEDAATSGDVEEYDVIIVGAGFAGLYQLDNLRRRGFSVQLLEAGGDIGGVWFWNSYPGARLDSEGTIYQYSRDDLWSEWQFSERFPGRDEVCNYFKYVDSKLDLRRDIRLNTRVAAATFDEARNQWAIETDAGSTFRANFMVMCTGFASAPYIPEFKDLDTFKGEIHHTGLWPAGGVDFKDKRVGVIGTGASGVQVIQEIAPVVKQLTVFQRTPNTALPMAQKQLTEEDQRDLKSRLAAGRFTLVRNSFGGVDMPLAGDSALAVSAAERNAAYEDRWNAGGFGFWLCTYADVLKDRVANLTAYEFWRDKVRLRIDKPELHEKLAPTIPAHLFGLKRPSLEQCYYEVFNQDNVTLVDTRETPLVEITPGGVRTSDRDYDFDVLVLATGYDAITGGLTRIDIRNVHGQSLKELWKDGAKAYLGFGIVGFPNMLSIYGPQSPSSFCNGPTCAENQGAWVVQCLEYMRDHGHKRIEAQNEAQEAWNRHANEVAESTLFGEADSWYMGANIPGKAKQLLAYAGGQPGYFDKCDEIAAKHYEGFALT